VAAAAVRTTARRTLEFDGMPALALFHADCGGHRSAAHEVWGGRDVPYLTGGPDELPDGARHQVWKITVDRERLREALNASPRTSAGARLDRVEVYERDSSGRASLVLVSGERSPLVRGEEFRAAVARFLGPASLRSTYFWVQQAGDRIEFAGRGFGHGVGLCQRGALKRAEAGASVEEILHFYFPGTLLQQGSSSHSPDP
jgi:stage II sporulation protein D